MTSLTWHLYRRLMRRSRLFWLMVLAAVPGVIVAIAGVDTPREGFESTYVGLLLSVGFTYAIAALVLTVSTLRDERDAGTLPYLYMRPLSRLTLAIGSVLAGMLAAVTIAVGGWLVALGAGAANGLPTSVTVPGAALFLSAALGYGALFVTIGYLFSRAVLVGLGYLVLIELVLSGLVTGLAQISVWRIAASVYVDLVDVTGIDQAADLAGVAPGVGGGMAKLVAVLAVGVAVLTWALRRRDAL